MMKAIQIFLLSRYITGAELENQGGHGTEFTHLEKRVFGNEAMTGTYTHNPVFSRITLALMEDTGWYVANYSNAEELTWGYRLGCSFVHASCYQYGVDKEPFCRGKGDDGDGESSSSSTTKTRCTAPDRAAVGLCNLKRYDDALLPQFRYFEGDDKIGGSVALADYCPFVQDFNWRRRDVILRGSACQLHENNPPDSQNYALETYGPESVCLDQPKPWDMFKCSRIRHSTHYGSGCYPVKCVSTSSSNIATSTSSSSSSPDVNVIVQVSNRSFHCMYPGQQLTVRVLKDDGWLYAGLLQCPDDCRFICRNVGGAESRLDADPEWCYRGKQTSDFSLDYSLDSLRCEARFAYLSDPLVLVMNVLVIILLSSNICIYF